MPAVSPAGETNEGFNCGCSENSLGQRAQFTPEDHFILLGFLSEGGEKGFHAEVRSRSCSGGMLRTSPFWEGVGRAPSCCVQSSGGTHSTTPGYPGG